MIVNGNALDVLKRMPPNTVHMIVTSSPYYGLRNYGTPPVVWGGEPDCDHTWGTVHPPGYRESDTKPGPMQHDGNKNRENLTSQVCTKCGAWKGELGLEPTPEMFVQHLTEIARECRRVLREDGVMWWNIGDSYSRSPGKGGSGTPTGRNNRGENYSGAGLAGLKEKDLIEIPSMLSASFRAPHLKCKKCGHVAHNNQWGRFPNGRMICPACETSNGHTIAEDGWYLRSRIPWIKRNALPSSVKDRPSSSIEYVFLFSKSKKYYYDYVAAMQHSSESYNKDKRPRGVLRQCVNPTSKYPDEGQFKKRPPVHEEVADGIGAMISPDDVVPQKQDLCGNETLVGFNARYKPNGLGLRYMRDSDFFFKTWQGLLHNEDGEPMALVVNPKGYKGAHFACFPVRFAEVMILAGTSEAGVCPECGAPWVRVVQTMGDTTISSQGYDTHQLAQEKGMTNSSRSWKGGDVPIATKITAGWKPSCTCNSGDPLPATVLDPFGGSGTVAVGCDLHNRRSIIVELNPEYCDLAEKRISEGK